MSRFDEAAATWDDGPKLERARRVAGLVRQHVPLRDDQRVLDLGAGTGLLSFELADAVGEVVLGDASAGMVEVAGRRIVETGLTDRFTALQFDLTVAIPDGLGTFDGVWGMLALHHVPELDVILARVHQLVRPGGWVAVIDLDHDVDGAFHAHVGDDFHGHHGFDRDALRRAMERAGFTGVAFTDAGAVDKELEDHDDGHPRSFPMFLATARR